MSKYPLVSVGIASYNNSKYILQTLECVQNQTYPNLEIIIVDDFSNDDSVEIINNWMKNTKLNTKLIINTQNNGVEYALNGTLCR